MPAVELADRACSRFAAGCLVVFGAVVALGAVAGESWDYRIERGDTLIGLQRRLLAPPADWRKLKRLNRIGNPYLLRPGSTLKIPLQWLRDQALVAEVLHVHGAVEVVRDGATQPLRGGDTLAAGDLVVTAAQSSATLRFADGARVLVRQNSRLRVERSARLAESPFIENGLRLEQGGADSGAPPVARPSPRRFELRTPMANLGVRGTEFRTRLDSERLWLEVLDGRVASGTAEVGAGFGTVASAGSVEPARALPPLPDLAEAPARVEHLPLTLRWAAGAAPQRYRAQVFDGEQLLLDGVFDAPQARWSDDLADGRYELRVRLVAADGLEGRDASAPFTLKARPEPPFLLRPRAGERTGDETIAFAWSRNTAASHYRLQISPSPDFAAPALDRPELIGVELSLPLPVGTHHWRIASVRPDGDQGPWSDIHAFTRVELPPAPAAQPPLRSADGVLLRWSAVPSPSTRYQLQVARDAAFTSLLVDEHVDATEWLLKPTEAGSYHVRVRGISGDGFAGPFGAPQVVDVTPAEPQRHWWLLLLVPLLMAL